VIKNIITITFLLFPSTLRSEDGVLFTMIQKENKIYRASQTLTSETKAHYQSDSVTLSKLKEKGANLPKLEKKHQLIVLTSTTGKKDVDGRIPFSAKLDSIQLTHIIDDQAEYTNNSSSPDTTIGITGYCDKDSTTIDKVHGRNIDRSMMEKFILVLCQLMNPIKFPAKPIRVGESFSQSLPINMPVQGVTDAKIVILATYTLKSVNSKSAYFDIIQNYTVTSGWDSIKISIVGNGHGQMTYDRAESKATSTTIQSTAETKLDLGAFVVIFETSADAEESVSIIDAK
jgi:hypothetical protein